MAGTQMMCPRRCRCSKPNEQVSVLFWSMYTHIIIKELKCVLRLCTCLFHNTDRYKSVQYGRQIIHVHHDSEIEMIGHRGIKTPLITCT